MHIRTEATVEIERTLDDVFDIFLDMDITRVMQGFGPFPAVERVESLEGEWTGPGATRRVYLSDGNDAHEELQVVESPRRFVYEISDASGPMGVMARSAIGEFIFTETTNGTRVDWSQTFDARGLAAPILLPVLKLGWARYLNDALQKAKTFSEADG